MTMAADDAESATRDAHWMTRALELARQAQATHGEVPVGAVLVLDEQIIGEGCNQNISLNDPSAHAEIMALRAAGAHVGNYRFPGATLFVTLEPCVMCAGAIIHARVARVVYATADPKSGAAGSVFDTLVSERHNHRVAVTSGVLAEEAGGLLREFFRLRR
jgi:tRNA(adenine34) deaminase